MDPTSSSLPISPIFIKIGVQERPRIPDDGLPYSSSSLLEQSQGNLLDNLEEITNLPTEFLSLGKFNENKKNVGKILNGHSQSF